MTQNDNPGGFQLFQMDGRGHCDQLLYAGMEGRFSASLPHLREDGLHVHCAKMRDERRHIPVLETTVLELLQPEPGDSVLDVTLGLAGHAKRFLEATDPDGQLYAVDADGDNLTAAALLLQPFQDRVHTYHANFGDVAQLGIPPVDLVFADLGVSSPHFDDPERGMSFRAEGPLDLRYDRSSGKPVSALLQDVDEHDLVFVLRSYGEVHDVRRLIAAIRAHPPATTQQMVKHVEDAYGWKAPKLLPQIFQALRIWVNDEMGTLQRLLDALPTLVKPGGKAAIISYHSLEDRLVKHAFKDLATSLRDELTGKVTVEAKWSILTPKGVVPSDEEIAQNPRARSARLRIIQHLPL